MAARQGDLWVGANAAAGRGYWSDQVNNEGNRSDINWKKEGRQLDVYLGMLQALSKRLCTVGPLLAAGSLQAKAVSVD